jgi:hypothetical protein
MMIARKFYADRAADVARLKRMGSLETYNVDLLHETAAGVQLPPAYPRHPTTRNAIP